MLHIVSTRRRIHVAGAISVLFVALLLMWLSGARPQLWACAPAPRPGEHVGIASETALIIWDADAKRQHFIRRATFDTKAKDFGFLVPTPSRPELDEAHDYTFKMLARITAPERRTVLTVVRADEAGDAAPAAGRAEVQVIESKRVGDFDAVVLRADDAGALEQWLKKHGYASDPALTDWLTPYVKKGWFLTAFKIVRDGNGQAPAAASAVRMSFTTPTPFFPYREPVSQGNSGPSAPQRLLRVYMLADKRMDATLGERGLHWPGTTAWAGVMPREENDFLLYTLKLHDKVKGKTWWLTEFEDPSSPRPGTDELYFSASADRSPVSRPPIINHLIHHEAPRSRISTAWAFALGCLGGVVLAGLVGIIVFGCLRRNTFP